VAGLGLSVEPVPPDDAGVSLEEDDEAGTSLGREFSLF